jgi:hypothetical protein
MKKFKKLLSVLSLLCFLLVAINSTQGPTGGGGTDVKRTVLVKNPQQGSAVGWPTPNLNDYVDIKLRISVKTFVPGTTQLVNWGTATIVNYTCDVNNPNFNFTNSINVPETGAFVIDVTTQSLQCTFVNANLSTCTFPNNHTTNQFWNESHSFTDNNTGDYNFFSLVKDGDECCQ